MRYLATGEICENMLQVIRFTCNVHFERILNTTNYGYFYIEIMISASHILGCLPGTMLSRGNFKEMLQFDAF